MIDKMPKELADLLPHQIDAVNKHIAGDKFPEPFAGGTTANTAMCFVLAMHYLNTAQDFEQSRKYFLMDLALRSSNYESWLGLALSNVKYIEKKYYGFPLEDGYATCSDMQQITWLCDSHSIFFLLCLRLSDLTSRLTETELFFAKSLDLKRNDCNALKQLGLFAYNFHSNMASHECSQLSENLLEVSKLSFQRSLAFTDPKENWAVRLMLGKIKEKNSITNAVSYFECIMNNLWEMHPEAPKKFTHRSPFDASAWKIELLYRITSCILKYVMQPVHEQDPKKRSHMATCLEANVKKFEIVTIYNENVEQVKMSAENQIRFGITGYFKKKNVFGFFRRPCSLAMKYKRCRTLSMTSTKSSKWELNV